MNNSSYGTLKSCIVTESHGTMMHFDISEQHYRWEEKSAETKVVRLQKISSLGQ